jgi:hypothetical protein
MRFVLILFMFASLFGVDNVATVEKIKGSVKVLKVGSIKKTRVKEGYKVEVGDRVSTSSSALAMLKLIDGSKIILENSSSIEFPAKLAINQLEGNVFYKIRKRDLSGAIKITTPFAIIGIKGTSFIVKSGKSDSIALEEGKIGVESVGEAFELYRQKVISEYTKFLLQQKNAYNEYLKQQGITTKEIVKSFDLEEGKQVSFDKRRVDEASLSQYSKDEFKHFKSLF